LVICQIVSAIYIMKYSILYLVVACFVASCHTGSPRPDAFTPATHSSVDSASLQNGYLVYHPIKTDAEGNIIPWYSPNLGSSFDHVLWLVWNFWDTMRVDINGLPYYMRFGKISTTTAGGWPVRSLKWRSPPGTCITGIRETSGLSIT
jgi:hypothetical protein